MKRKNVEEEKVIDRKISRERHKDKQTNRHRGEQEEVKTKVIPAEDLKRRHSEKCE